MNRNNKYVYQWQAHPFNNPNKIAASTITPKIISTPLHIDFFFTQAPSFKMYPFSQIIQLFFAVHSRQPGSHCLRKLSLGST